MADLVLTLIGRDRAGIVAAVAEDIAFHGGNWERSELAEIAGTFAGVIVVSVPEGRLDELLASLVIMREQGVHVTAELIEAPSEVPTQKIQVLITGEDRPGVVREVSAAVSELGATIIRMGTVTDLKDADGKRQFEFTAQLGLSEESAPYKVLDAIDAVGTKLGVTVHAEEVGDPDAD